MKRLFFKLTGGRPMIRGDCLFVDVVNGREVWAYTDRLGRSWMAQGFFGWSLFRVAR